MNISIWPNGEWAYDFMYDSAKAVEEGARVVNLDRLYLYKDLTKVEIKAIEDALSD